MKMIKLINEEIEFLESLKEIIPCVKPNIQYYKIVGYLDARISRLKYERRRLKQNAKI